PSPSSYAWRACELLLKAGSYLDHATMSMNVYKREHPVLKSQGSEERMLGLINVPAHVGSEISGRHRAVRALSWQIAWPRPAFLAATLNRRRRGRSPRSQRCGKRVARRPMGR